MSTSQLTALIVGASSGVGLALAKKLAQQGYNLHLVARGQRDLESIASHLSLVNGVEVTTSVFDLAGCSNTEARELIQNVYKKLGLISRVFLVSGANSANDELPINDDVIDLMFMINGVGPIHLLNNIINLREAVQLQSVTVCSTIAVPVPRKKNVAYSSAKGALETFTLGSRHYFSNYDIPVQVYRFGYIASNLSYGKKLLFPVADPQKAANVLFNSCNKNIGLRYFPRFWFFIIVILKYLPWSIYRKLSF